MSHTKAQANAYLIAAAPDLLEACEEFEKALPNNLDIAFASPTLMERCLELARAAIAKAKGNQ